jgi:hypothetical protein
VSFSGHTVEELKEGNSMKEDAYWLTYHREKRSYKLCMERINIKRTEKQKVNDEEVPNAV